MQAVNKPFTFRRTLDNIIRFTSSIAENTVFTGTFSGGENIVVRGSVKGESNVKGTVVVTETGRWHGHLTADVVIIAGDVKGNIVAHEKIEVQNTALVEGNLQSPSIAIESGAVHDGRIVMSEGGTVDHYEEKRARPIGLVSK